MSEQGKSDLSGPDRRAIVTGAGALALASTGLLSRAADAAVDLSPVVETTDGRVRGVAAGGLVQFLGIPYGAPTGGANRFMPPVKPAPWSGVRETTDYGPVSPQTPANAPPDRGGALSEMHAAPKAGESEDCLNLNIWTPAADGARRPVMVWIHGGGYFSGSGSMAVYNGANLAKAGDVVVVNITHRLNVLGYTFLGGAGGQAFAHSGNVGMLDIVMALEWVRDNIEQFGGDPRQVMIFGESGGAGKVSTLLAMPGAKGLFHRAAIESGPAIFLPEAADADRVAKGLMAELGLAPDQALALQSLPLAELTAGYFRFVRKWPAGPIAFSPMVDGDVIPMHPGYPGAPASGRDVAVLIGSNLSESAYMWMGDPTVFGMDETKLRARLTSVLSAPDIDKAITFYRRHYSWATPTDLWLLINTDRSMRKNTLRYADARAASGGAAPTYLYHLRFQTPYMGGQLHTPHFVDVPLIFRNQNQPGVSAFIGGGDRANRMSAVLSDAWVAFARTGSPRTPALPDWTPYSLPARPTMILNETSGIENDPDAELRRFWESYDYQII